MAVLLSKQDFIQELYQVYIRSTLLRQPPYILQENDEYSLSLYYSQITKDSSVYLRNNVNIDEEISELDINTLFFLKDGYYVTFENGNISKAIIGIFGKEAIYNKKLLEIADRMHVGKDIVLDDSKYYRNLSLIMNFAPTKLYFKSGKLSDFLNYNLDVSNCLDSETGVLRSSLVFDTFIVDDFNVNSVFLKTNFYIKELYIENVKNVIIDFKNLKLNKIVLLEGTESICFKNTSYCGHFEIVFPKSLKFIGKESFSYSHIKCDFSNLHDCYIDDKVFYGANISPNKIPFLDALYLGEKCFSNSSIRSIKIPLKTYLGNQVFYSSNLYSIEIVKSDIRDVDEIKNNYNKICSNLNNKFRMDSLDSLTGTLRNYYEICSNMDICALSGVFDNDYIVNDSLFKCCYNLKSINISYDNVFFKRDSIAWTSIYLKLSGMKKYSIEDKYNTLLCTKEIDLYKIVYDFCIKEFKDDGELIHKQFLSSMMREYRGNPYYNEDMLFNNISNMLYDAVRDTVLNFLNLFNDEMLNVNVIDDTELIPYYHLTLLGEKNRPEIDLKKLMIKIISDWMGGRCYEEMPHRSNSNLVFEYVRV